MILLVAVVDLPKLDLMYVLQNPHLTLWLAFVG